MSDIFISYKSEDRERIQTLVKALEVEGWSVWWDRTIIPGDKFRQVISKALDDAKCVIVVWSRESVLSEWVIDEADRVKQRGILIPVLIDEVEIPLGFRQIQAASLVDWQGTSPHPEFDQLLKSIAEILRNPPRTNSESKDRCREAREWKAASITYKMVPTCCRRWNYYSDCNCYNCL